MAFLLNKTTIASHFRSHSQKTEELAFLWRRRLHIEPGPREKALLAEDSALKPFKSYKQSVKKLRRIGNVLTIVVVAVKDHQKVVSMPSIVKVPKCYVPQVPIPRVPVTEDFED